jgi:hypothetical protein
MKYIKIILPLMLITFSTLSQNYMTGLSWSMGFASGKTTDFIGAPSFTGCSLEGHRLMSRTVSLGFETGWNILNEQNADLITVNNTSISGQQGRYLNIIPVLLSASYYIKSSKSAKFVPFIRANVGTYYILQRFDIGVFTIDNDNWHFGVSPELGFMYSTSKQISLLVNAKYNYAFDSGTRLGGDETNDYAFYSLNLGITYFK